MSRSLLLASSLFATLCALSVSARADEGAEEDGTAPEAAEFSGFQQFDATYLYGFNWQLGRERRDTLTLEYADAWRYGDNYFFVDLYGLAERDETTPTQPYAEYSPRLSLSRISGVPLAFGPLADVLVAGQVNVGSGFLAHLWGIGIDLALPGFAFFQINGYLRDDVDQAGFTGQATLAWLLPFQTGPLGWSLLGFLDIFGAEGDAAWQLLTQIQLLLDVGSMWGSPGHVRIGVEMHLWRNEFGIPGQHEHVPQPALRLTY